MADPVIPASDTVGYVFSFADAGAAAHDPVIGTYRGQEVLLFIANISTVVPLSGYQPMVSQPGPINDALYNHPNLLFAFDLALIARGEAATLKSVFSGDQMAQMIVILSNYGLIVPQGTLGYTTDLYQFGDLYQYPDLYAAARPL